MIKFVAGLFLFLIVTAAAEPFIIKVRPFDKHALYNLPKGPKRPSADSLSSHLLKCLSTIEFSYRAQAFHHDFKKGYLVVNNDLVDDLKEILKQIYEEPSFSFHSVKPMEHYVWDDDQSMMDNNTSGFNYRYIAGTKKLSNHATGRAIDINPRVNPWVSRDGELSPKNGTIDPSVEGSLLPGSRTHYIVELFKAKGFSWGGDWKSSKDYQHFEKKIRYPGNKYCQKPY